MIYCITRGTPNPNVNDSIASTVAFNTCGDSLRILVLVLALALALVLV